MNLSTAFLFGAALETSLMSVIATHEGKMGLARLHAVVAAIWLILGLYWV